MSAANIPLRLFAIATMFAATLMTVRSAGTDYVDSTSLFSRKQAIAESEYRIQWQENVATYQAPNRAANLRFTFWNDAVTVELRDKRKGRKNAPEDNWKVMLRLVSFGKAGLRQRAEATTARVTEHTAAFTAGQLEYQYANEKGGFTRAS